MIRWARASPVSRATRLFRAEPTLIENSVLMQGQRKKDAIEYIQAIKNMIQDLPNQCKIILLPIPHCIQLGSPYLQRLQLVGAKVNNYELIQNVYYPFIEHLEKEVQSKNVQVVNPLPHLQYYNQKEELYYNNDPHLNERGHQIISKQIQEILAKKNIFDEAQSDEIINQ